VYHDASITVGVTNGSATVTSPGAFSTEWAGRNITISGDAKTYRILSVASASSLTLASNYAGSTDAAAPALVSTSTPNRLYWSRQYYPESWRLATQAVDSLRDVDDRFVCLTEYLGDPWIIGSRTCQRYVFSDDPANGEFVTVSGENGVWNARCVIKPDSDTMLAWGSNGVWIVAGGRPTKISDPIDDDWRDLIDYDYTGLIHGWYNPEDSECKWAFVESGDTFPKRVLVYDMNGRRWRIDEYRSGVDASTVVADSNGRLRAATSDATNDMTYYDEGATDGVPSALTDQGRLTVVAGGSTTTTVVSESLPTGAKGTSLAGLPLYSPDLDETVIIASNTSDTITHGAFSSALTPANLCYAGSIPVEVEFAWWAGQDQSVEKVPEKVWTYWLPSSADTEVEARIYREFGTTAMTVRNIAGQTFPKGVGRNSDGDGFTLDLSTADGFMEIPVGALTAKTFKCKITCDDPSGEFTLMDVQWKPGDRAPGGDGE